MKKNIILSIVFSFSVIAIGIAIAKVITYVIGQVMKIKIGVINRHVNLTIEYYDIIFNEEYKILKNL